LTALKSKGDLGHTDLVQDKINGGSGVPIRQSLRRLPFGKRQTEKEEILRMLDLGVIEPSSSPWSFPVSIVPKYFAPERVSKQSDIKGKGYASLTVTSLSFL
jgi:hypothetical protein